MVLAVPIYEVTKGVLSHGDSLSLLMALLGSTHAEDAACQAQKAAHACMLRAAETLPATAAGIQPTDTGLALIISNPLLKQAVVTDTVTAPQVPCRPIALL